MNTPEKSIALNKSENPLYFFQPAGAWFPLLSYIFLTAALLGMGGVGSKILNVVFPIGAAAIGCLLYFRYPIIYVSFTWWLFFLSPLIRRIADFRGGAFVDPSTILLAPYLAVLFCLHTLYENLPKTHKQGTFPFILALCGILYGYLVGLANDKPIAVTLICLKWVAPVLFGYYLLINWRNYPAYRQTIQRTFLWGVLISGIYGVYQFQVAPDWDRLWLVSTKMTSAGSPEPLGIRVWSTMNSPGTFSHMMMAGLLILFSCTSFMRFPAAGFGYLSFLLTLVRTGWIGWIISLATMSTSMQPKLRNRLIITVLVLAICVVPLTTIEPFSKVISDRVGTLADIKNDGSAIARQGLYTRKIDSALDSVLGDGFGGVGYDSALLNCLFQLGWIGTIPYLGGMVILILSILKISVIQSDSFANISRAIAISSFIFLTAGSAMIELGGMILWGFMSIAIMADRYHQHQNKLSTQDRSKLLTISTN
ncbi:Glucose-6-phosphate isomerase [Tumidithrix helvetica PCC 7403]|uniref:O-antigen ligase domain-containing protein n=1 Tax=Tumidithrix helvetica TaxID=3457545 RepID=UPI003CC3E158